MDVCNARFSGLDKAMLFVVMLCSIIMAWNSPSKRIERIESVVDEIATNTHGIRKNT